MQFSIQTIVLFSALASTSFGADIFSTFFNRDGKRFPVNFSLGKPDDCINFDPLDKTFGSAVKVSFSQGLNLVTPKDSFCLKAFKELDCKGPPPDFNATQTFQKLDIAPAGSAEVPLKEGGVRNAPSFKWNKGACPTP